MTSPDPGGRPVVYGTVLLTVFLLGTAGILASLGQNAPSPESGAEPAPDPSFSSCVEDLRAQAEANGISHAIVAQSLTGLRPDPEITARAHNQPEFIKPIWDYLDAAVSNERINTGRLKLAEWAQVLDAIETRYGVDRHVVLAIWGLESSYGAALENHATLKPVIRSIATLACSGPDRNDLWREQILAALRIIERGETTPDRMAGSWAGAMGHTQFLPATYLAHAVDFDGDGKRDIWGTIPDALASTAHYLKTLGWRPDEGWGYEVELPPTFDYALADEATERPVSEWMLVGLRPARGGAIPSSDEKAVLMLPAGVQGPAFLLLSNFGAIVRYNRSAAYALSVGHLANRLRGMPAVVQSWPRDGRTLTMSERSELQALLDRRGFAVGSHDGMLGPKTRAAVRAYQSFEGLTPDGHADALLLERLKQQR